MDNRKIEVEVRLEEEEDVQKKIEEEKKEEKLKKKNIKKEDRKKKKKKKKKEKEKDKDKDKEKISERDNTNYLEHTVTTDFSLAETNPEIKTDKIIKGTEKLNDIFIKSAIFYRILGIKRGFTNFSLNKEITDSSNIMDSTISDKEKKEIKISNVENESDNDEDSGESSFGI